MATLIAVYTADGCVGRCDAKCYSASEPGCDCICGGLNHAAGKEQAITNTHDRAEEWLQRYAQERGLDTYEGIVFGEDARQTWLNLA